MKNLAGDKDCDVEIRCELTLARIDIVERANKGEVPASIGGQLAHISFDRCWYYWRARGLVPFSVAKEIYEDPIGRLYVRFNGSCVCPEPDGDTECYIDSEAGLRFFADVIRKHFLGSLAKTAP